MCAYGGKMNIIKAWCPSQLCGVATCITPQFSGDSSGERERERRDEKGCALHARALTDGTDGRAADTGNSTVCSVRACPSGGTTGRSLAFIMKKIRSTPGTEAGGTRCRVCHITVAAATNRRAITDFSFLFFYTLEIIL